MRRAGTRVSLAYARRPAGCRSLRAATSSAWVMARPRRRRALRSDPGPRLPHHGRAPALARPRRLAPHRPAPVQPSPPRRHARPRAGARAEYRATRGSASRSSIGGPRHAPNRECGQASMPRGRLLLEPAPAHRMREHRSPPQLHQHHRPARRRPRPRQVVRGDAAAPTGRRLVAGSKSTIVASCPLLTT